MVEFIKDGELKTVHVRNSLNYGCFEIQGEFNSGVSQTVPDQALSVRQILERYARGLPLGGQRVPTFDEDDDLPDFRTLDLSEREEYKARYGEELEQLKNKFKSYGKKSMEGISEKARPSLEGNSVGTEGNVETAKPV